MNNKICIVGSAPQSRDLYPRNREDVEIWTTAAMVLPEAKKIFEIHDSILFLPQRLQDIKTKCEKATLVTVKEIAGIKNQIIFPMKKAQEFLKKHSASDNYIMSSVGYMIIMAILENATEIMLYGVDMKASDEYAYQKANCEFLLGIASGMGIKITIPKESSLLKSLWLYGTLESYKKINPKSEISSDKLTNERLVSHKNKEQELKKSLTQLDGALGILKQLQKEAKDGVVDVKAIESHVDRATKSYLANNANLGYIQGAAAECKVMASLSKNYDLGGV